MPAAPITEPYCSSCGFPSTTPWAMFSAAELMTVRGVRNSCDTAVTKSICSLASLCARVLVKINIAMLITRKKSTPKLIARSRRAGVLR